MDIIRAIREFTVSCRAIRETVDLNLILQNHLSDFSEVSQ